MKKFAPHEAQQLRAMGLEQHQIDDLEKHHAIDFSKIGGLLKLLVGWLLSSGILGGITPPSSGAPPKS